MILSKSVSAPRYEDTITELDLYDELHVISESVVRVFHEIGKMVSDDYTSDIEAYRSYIKDINVFLDKREVFIRTIYRQNYIALQNMKNKFNNEFTKVIEYFDKTKDSYDITVAKFDYKAYASIPNFKFIDVFADKNLNFNVKEKAFKTPYNLQGTLNQIRGKSIGAGALDVDAFYKKMETSIKYTTETMKLNKDSVTDLMTLIDSYQIDKISFDNIISLIQKTKHFFTQCLYYSIEDIRQFFPGDNTTEDKVQKMYSYTDYKFRVMNGLLSHTIDAYNYKTKVMYDALRICIDNAFQLKSERDSLSECTNPMVTVSNYRRTILEMNRLLQEYYIYHDKGYNFDDMYNLSEQVLRNRQSFIDNVRANIKELKRLYKDVILAVIDAGSRNEGPFQRIIHNAACVDAGKLSTISQTYATPGFSEKPLSTIMADYSANHSQLYKAIERVANGTIMDINSQYVKEEENLVFIINKIVTIIPEELKMLESVVNKFEKGVSTMVHDSIYSDLIQDEYNNLLSVMLLDFHQQVNELNQYIRQLTYISPSAQEDLMIDSSMPIHLDYYTDTVLNTYGLKDNDKSAILALQVKLQSLYNSIADNYPYVVFNMPAHLSRLQEAALTTKERKELKDEEFGLPEERKYPLTDRQHVIKAIQFFKHCPEDKKSALAHRIKKQADKYEVEIKNTEILEYLHLRESVEYYDPNESTEIYGMEYVKYITEMNLITQAKMNFVYTIYTF